ncbi:hypothetical protein PTI97_04310 [Exiguobacterium marinum]|uniref:DUF4367 domain-containing protein n=1 Tax=Exiguobacterium marinum TaxID=273528 RepID=A0ABY7X1L9_9BACL|nr:hypothetical protein [Exiguobacterium marinum]WDH76745.1 hypothetical protein PTI97_04310 [Exiguobacterium marinum]
MRRIGVIGVLVLGLAGCTPSEEMEFVETGGEEIETSEWIGTLVEDVPKGTESLSDAVVHQITLQYKDGSEGHLSTNDVIYETTVEDIGLIAIAHPNQTPSFGVYHYSRDGEWVMHGMKHFGIAGVSKKIQHGLALPQGSMYIIDSEIDDSERPVKLWTLYDETQLVTILMTDAFSVGDGEPINQNADGAERYRLNQPSGNGLYYISQDKLILVTGNVSEEELLTLVDSLPDPSSESFPFHNSK